MSSRRKRDDQARALRARNALLHGERRERIAWARALFDLATDHHTRLRDELADAYRAFAALADKERDAARLAEEAARLLATEVDGTDAPPTRSLYCAATSRNYFVMSRNRCPEETPGEDARCEVNDST